MLISILRYIKGYLRIRITGYSPERFLNLCSHHRIYLWGLEPCSHAYEMYITVSGFRKLKPIIKKTKTKITIEKRYGLPFFLHKYRKRKMFFAGAFICILTIYVMSLFIWNIHIDGNYSRTDETILQFLESTHVQHGMKKSKVDCERIVKDIRKEFNDIIWVSASIQGTRLMIQVKENSDTVTEAPEEKAGEPSDLIAEQDATIVSMVTRNGTPQVGVGDTVAPGDVLVSGRVEVKNDGGEVIDYQYQSSDADIYARTTINYENKLDLKHDVKQYSDASKKAFYLKIGTYTFCFGSLKQDYAKYESYSEETQCKIGEHFYIPVSYGFKTVKEYAFQKETYAKKEYQDILTEEFERFCADLEKKGVQILENDVKIYTGKNVATAKGTLTLIEPIGKTVPTEIVEVPEQIDTEGVE